MSLDSVLTSLYGNTSDKTGMEKTAEAAMRQALTTSAPSKNPYDGMSLEELTKLAGDLGASAATEAAAGTPSAEEQAELEKVAFDMLGGQVMAHAMTHELGLIKTAVAHGKCRVCKEKKMDVEGSSICSSCAK